MIKSNHRGYSVTESWRSEDEYESWDRAIVRTLVWQNGVIIIAGSTVTGGTVKRRSIQWEWMNKP